MTQGSHDESQGSHKRLQSKLGAGACKIPLRLLSHALAFLALYSLLMFQGMLIGVRAVFLTSSA